MENIWLYAILASFAVSLLAFTGILFISVDSGIFRKKVSILISLAVGALFGNVFIHLIPEAFEKSSSGTLVGIYILVGIFIFFLLDKFLHWHCHNSTCERTPLGYKTLIADGIHNLVDGIVIGVTFLASPALGLATTIAVMLHEVPQEIVDFSILIHAGFSKTRALVLNFYSALSAVFGTVIALLLGTRVEVFVPVMLGLTAGMFIYLAGSDLVPELHQETSTKKSLQQVFAAVLGVVIMILIA